MPGKQKSSEMYKHSRAMILRAQILASAYKPIFFHPDCTVGFGITPNHAFRLVGFTTGRDLHPALKILLLN